MNLYFFLKYIEIRLQLVNFGAGATAELELN